MTPRVAKPEKRASKLEKKVQLKKEKRQIYWENVLKKGTNGVLESKIHVNSPILQNTLRNTVLSIIRATKSRQPLKKGQLGNSGRAFKG